MATTLTAQGVVRFKPDPHKRREIPDAVMPGLYLVIQRSGLKSWAVRYRHRGKPRKLTIGRFPVFDLSEARAQARDALQAVALGRDPCHEKRQMRAQDLTPDRDLVSTHVEAYLARYVRPKTKPSTAVETERRFRKYVLPHWGERRIQDITRRDVIELLDGIVDSGTPVAANRMLSTLKTLFGWLIDRAVVEASPCIRVKPPAAENSRDRVLTDDELRLLWHAAEGLGTAYGGFAQILLLTGQRRDEVAGMRRSELKGWDLWTIPAARTKSGVEHDVPLSEPAQAILASVPQIGTEGFMFTLNGSAPVTSYSRAKRTLDERVRELARKADNNAREIPNWTFHDLRRTAASGMARLGIPVNVIESVLGHRGGAVSGVAAVYNRHSYLPEKRRALEAWAGHVMQLVGDPPASNVTPFWREG
jgi:integrase